MRTVKYLLWVLLGGQVFFSCSVLRLYEPVRVRFNDWVTYGGNPQRTHLANEEIPLPIEQRWEYDANAGFGNGSALVADSLVFVGTRQGELHVVRIANGTRVGVMDVGSAIVGVPIVENHLVYVPLSRNGHNLIAYNLQEGAFAWRLEISDIETSPLMIENQLFVTTMQGQLVCVERFTGRIAWQYTIRAHNRIIPIRSSPATDYERIFFGADDGKLYAVGRYDGKLRWVFSSGKSIVATPSIHEGRVFVGSMDHSLYCLDAESGQLIWKRDLGGTLYASQAVDRERVYVGTSRGEFFCLDQHTGDVLWKSRARSVISAAPLIAGSVVFVGSLDKHLYGFDAMTGEVLWSHEFSSRIRTSPVLRRGYLILLLEDRQVVAFSYAKASANINTMNLENRP